ncbi:MAG: queuosine precursor transporter [Candidatus Competibacteraceae bacterium]
MRAQKSANLPKFVIDQHNCHSMNHSNTSTHSTAFVVVVAGFVTTLLIANIIAVKLIDVGGWILPAGTLIFPVSYILGDVLTEVYGYRRARQVIWLGFGCNLLAVASIWLAQVLPPAGFWDGQAAFERILGYTPRLLAASFLAYLLGEFTNARFSQIENPDPRTLAVDPHYRFHLVDNCWIQRCS